MRARERATTHTPTPRPQCKQKKPPCTMGGHRAFCGGASSEVYLTGLLQVELTPLPSTRRAARSPCPHATRDAARSVSSIFLPSLIIRFAERRPLANTEPAHAQPHSQQPSPGRPSQARRSGSARAAASPPPARQEKRRAEASSDSGCETRPRPRLGGRSRSYWQRSSGWHCSACTGAARATNR